MTYRVIYSEFIRHSDGSYEAVDETARSLGPRERFWDAEQTALCWDSSIHIAWVEVLDKDGLWHYADSDGRAGEIASHQDLPEDID